MPARPEYDLHLDEAEANIVIQGLGELPAKVGYNLITKVAEIVATTNKAWQAAQQPTLPGVPPAAPVPPQALSTLAQSMADAALAHAGSETHVASGHDTP